MSFKFTMEPRVSYLSELLKDINEGFLKIPRFQRDLVWKPQQQRELLCSIFEGLPIGALLVWNTRLSTISVYDRIGPFPVKSDVITGTNLYLMDGLQRLSTLYGTLIYPIEGLEPTKRTSPNVKELSVYCDLTTDDVENMFLFESELDPVLTKLKYAYMPLNLVFKSKELLKFQRAIPASHESALDRSDAIVTAFKNYKIPVIPLESDDQALVTKSFERINSRGTVMTEAHMLNALSYSDHFDLLGSIEKNREFFLNTSLKWRNIDPEFVLMLLKLKLGFELYSKDTDKLAKSINNEVVAEVFGAINKLAAFSEKYLCIESPSEFPYRLQMLGIARAYLDKPKISYVRLKAWFYVSTYTSSFGTTARNSQRALADLKDFLVSGDLSWTLSHKPVIQSLDGLQVNTGAARIKAWTLALRQKYAYSVENANSGQRLALFMPKEFKARGRRPGFYFLVNSTKSKNFDLLKLTPEEMEGQFLNPALIKAYKRKAFLTFAQERERLMFDFERKNIIGPASTIAKIHDMIKFD
ncbi:DUF262 domain-containing protein [Pseudomonas syringae]|uniref:DUF262 domain-containing protein n=1 Tax=Pseudomonas syringae TaxID=317 RepID=UPI003F82EF8D